MSNKHTLYAAKDLVLEGKQVKRGQVLAVVETEHDVRRVVAGLSNGAATMDKPTDPPAPATAKAK